MDIRKSYTDYMENALRDEKDSEIVYLYERHLLEKMHEKTENAKNAGLQDESIIADLVKSEFTDLKAGYKLFYAQEKQKAKEKALRKFFIIGSLVLLVGMLVSYFAVSFITQRWEESWLIIIFCVTLWVDTLVGIKVRKMLTMKKVFHIPARIAAGLGMMMFTTLIFLLSLVYFRFENYWIIYPAGVFCIYVVDAIIAQRTKQRMRLLNYFIYVPAAMPMLYVVLSGLHIIPWSPGWLLMPLSVVIDLLIALGAYINNRKYVYKPEKEENE